MISEPAVLFDFYRQQIEQSIESLRQQRHQISPGNSTERLAAIDRQIADCERRRELISHLQKSSGTAGFNEEGLRYVDIREEYREQDDERLDGGIAPKIVDDKRRRQVRFTLLPTQQDSSTENNREYSDYGEDDANDDTCGESSGESSSTCSGDGSSSSNNGGDEGPLTQEDLELAMRLLDEAEAEERRDRERHLAEIMSSTVAANNHTTTLYVNPKDQKTNKDVHVDSKAEEEECEDEDDEQHSTNSSSSDSDTDWDEPSQPYQAIMGVPITMIERQMEQLYTGGQSSSKTSTNASSRSLVGDIVEKIPSDLIYSEIPNHEVRFFAHNKNIIKFTSQTNLQLEAEYERLRVGFTERLNMVAAAEAASRSQDARMVKDLIEPVSIGGMVDVKSAASTSITSPVEQSAQPRKISRFKAARASIN